MTPRVTAIIGAYNNAATLERAIDSLLAQSVSDLELIVIDDGSHDDSPAIARRAAARDPRVRAIALGENLGISRSLNHALGLARAELVAIQDADDYSEPTRLERQLAALEREPDIAVVGCRMREVDERGASSRRGRASSPATCARRCCTSTRSPTARRRCGASSCSRSAAMTRDTATRWSTTSGCGSPSATGSSRSTRCWRRARWARERRGAGGARAAGRDDPRTRRCARAAAHAARRERDRASRDLLSDAAGPEAGAPAPNRPGAVNR